MDGALGFPGHLTNKGTGHLTRKKIAHLTSIEINQMTDVPEGLLLYTEPRRRDCVSSVKLC
jgi:hypothetical protein